MFLKHKKLILIFIVCLGLLASLPALASWPATPLLPPCTASGCCGFNDFVLLGVNLSKMILGLVGSLALLFFIYGGIMFLIAGGSSEMIGKGKKIITNAVIGVALVLGAWIIVNFAIAALTGTPVSHVKIFGTQDWWITPSGAAPSCGVTTSGEATGGGTTATSGAGKCHCTGTVTAGALLPNTTFDSYCSAVHSACPVCGTPSGSANCSIDLSVDETECNSYNTDKSKLAAQLGLPEAALLLVNVNGSCTFSK
jgi:hypothetical protein